MADTQTGQLVVAQNQHAFIQDTTKGTVQVYAGPHALPLSNTDRPVVYDNTKDEFTQVNLQQAIRQNPLVPEGHYLVLENPAFSSGDKLLTPGKGGNSPVDLQIGRKINIPGPATFALWPGQYAEAIPGHHLRSNQYLIARVYNAEQANNNAPAYLKPELVVGKPVDGQKATAKPLANGQMLVIKGTEVPFFIPPTGFEVLAENGKYVREALTLERLEYCILLAESGEKRYERGPKVVFPEATETYMTKRDNPNGASDRKFKAIELNDQMGLYIKVIADYIEDGGTVRTTGDELFITGKEQRIYYPRPEHALIEYKDPKEGFARQRYYGIAIPKGEGRYCLVKNVGDVKTEKGPQIFLPDPRNQVIVRRVLDDKTVALWYPGNTEAIEFNENLRKLLGSSGDNYVPDAVVRSASIGTDRSINRLTKGSGTIGANASLSSFEGAKLERGTQYTPPPMLTLNTKYDGVPTISPYVGYAVQVVDKSGNRRVVVGPATILLEYDEALAVLELSTGKPKTTDNILRAVYLRVDNNLVSDIVRVETKDLVNVDIKLSYRVNFLREHKDKWFSVENYVKYLCDHMRSILKGTVKAIGVKEFIENSTAVVRDAILGKKEADKVRSKFFPENGMEVYDVEVLGATISDEKIAASLKNAQVTAVQSAIGLSLDEGNLAATRVRTKIQGEVADLEHQLSIKKLNLGADVAKQEAEIALMQLEAEIAEQVRTMQAELKKQESLNEIGTAELGRRKASEDYTIALEEKRTAFFKDRMAAITPDLISAMDTLGRSEFATKLSAAIAPLALHEQTGLGTTIEKVFKGTALEGILNNVQGKTATSR